MASPETVRWVLELLSEAYPDRFKLGENTLLVWARLLADLDDQALMAAAVEHATQSKWPPSVAELRELVFGAAEGPTLTAGEAWERITKAMSRFGLGDIPRFGAAALDGPQTPREFLGEMLWKCVEGLGGWRNLCLSEEGMVDRAHFFKVYEQMNAREQRERRALPEVRDFQLALQAARAERLLGAGDEDKQAS